MIFAESTATLESTNMTAAPPVQASSFSVSITNLASSDLNQLLQSTNYVPRDAAASLREMGILDDKQKLGAGDRMSFRVLEDQEDSKLLLVNEGGSIDFPLVGPVLAQGRTCRAVALDAKSLLEKEYYYQATVILSLDQVNKNRTLGRVYVTGAIRMSGPQDIPGTETYTISKVILRAGGFSDFADKKHVRLVRKLDQQTKTFVINVGEIWEKGKVQNDMEVLADDLVYVPERAINF
jgi:polysaccharide biosynthesis/export protein